MRPALLLILLALAGCVAEPEPDVSGLSGPYYDGGYYYDRPRYFDYDVEQRAAYAQPYYGPVFYPYGYFGGGYYRRPYYDRHDFHDDHHGRFDGPDRPRERGGPAEAPSRTGPHGGVIDAGPSRPAPSPTHGSVGGPIGGGPHGRH